MDPINERIAFLVDNRCNGNKSAFAREIGITPAYAAQLYSSQRDPSDRTISDICRVFGVDPVWLRTGEGEPFTPLSRAEELAEIFAEVQIGDDPKARLIKAMARMPAGAFPAFLDFLQSLSDTLADE